MGRAIDRQRSVARSLFRGCSVITAAVVTFILSSSIYCRQPSVYRHARLLDASPTWRFSVVSAR